MGGEAGVCVGLCALGHLDCRGKRKIGYGKKKNLKKRKQTHTVINNQIRDFKHLSHKEQKGEKHQTDKERREHFFEYISIYNPTSENINISGWYITNTLNKRKTDQTKIVFPESTEIPKKTFYYITENADKYYWETGKIPDFEYNRDEDNYTAQMLWSKKFIMSNIFSSSIGKKLIMSLAGLFLIIFLIVHLGINITLIICKSREYFNIAAHFMSSNIVIKIFEIILFGGFILHMFYGLILQIQNWLARPKRYKIANFSETSFFSKYMIHTAIIISIFLVLHLLDFFIKSKFTDNIEEVVYKGKEYKDLGLLVIQRFKIGWVVIVYVAALLFLGFHLHHGFQSAFKSLGINHKKYSPVINSAGVIYTLIITLGFISIPVYIYFIR